MRSPVTFRGVWMAAAMLATGCTGSEDTSAPVPTDSGVRDAVEAAPSQDANNPETSGSDTSLTDADLGEASCKTSSDCGWGEIDGEILSRADCPCLYGCAFLPQNKTTIERRRAQYDALCDPKVNGKGESCGVDDCAAPPPIECKAGVCTAVKD